MIKPERIKMYLHHVQKSVTSSLTLR